MQSPSLLLLLLLLRCFSVVITRGLQCGSLPELCANGGTCLSLSEGQGNCRCAPGFLGETCQFPDPCQNTQLCQNGGSCQALLPAPLGSPSPPTPLAPSFSCACLPGFTGERCQARLEDPCPPSFCSKRGRCHIQASGRPQCSCMPGWTGKRCWGGQEGTGRSNGLGCGWERWNWSLRNCKPFEDRSHENQHANSWQSTYP
nr:neurogenic locus notch homolog protein 4-like [Aotus nancymaae]XP_021522770.1 neurogenic locus notch homolog protein 4-like [Aotus nancymaae]